METPQDNQPEKMDTFPVSPVKESIFEQINAPHQEIRKSTTPDFVPISPFSKCTPDEKGKSCKGIQLMKKRLIHRVNYLMRCKTFFRVSSTYAKMSRLRRSVH